MSQTWSAGQYKRAAEAHKKVCDYMLKNIEQRDISKNEKSMIYFELLYLSSYVLECMLKSVILANQADYSRDKAYNKSELDAFGVWTHNIKKSNGLWQKTIDIQTMPDTYDFSLISKFENQGDFVEMRYSIGETDKRPDSSTILTQYKDTIVPIFNHLKSLY